MKKTHFRTPRNYDGTDVTTYRMNDLLPQVLTQVNSVYHQRSDMLLAMWPEMVGPQMAPMTQAVSFSEGVLLVKVKNSTLHSLLSQNEKPRLLSALRKKFPRVEIKTINFRIG